MVVQHNMQAANTNRQLGISGGIKAKSIEKLSSGYKINRAADDAAGLSISEKMRFQVRGLNKASSNASDGVSLIQTAEGALNEVHAILNRMKELSVQAANDTNTSVDRESIQKEINELTSEVDRIASSTQFNTMNLLDGSLAEKKDDSNGLKGPDTYQFGAKTVTFNLIGNDGKIANVSSTEGLDANGARSADMQNLVDYVKTAASSAVGKLYSNYGNLFSNAATNGIEVGLDLGNIDGSGGTLAYAGMSYSTSDSSSFTAYTMKVDTSDYPNYSSLGDDKKDKLAATVAHEMTHMVMYDTLTVGMVGKGSTDKFPKWFIEGTAQTSSGDNGWLSNHLTTSSSDSDISNYMKDSKYREYGAGYVAAMYLGQMASGQSAVTAGNIRNGLSKVFSELSSGKTLSDVIKDNTSYNGISDFENHVFNSPDANTITFVKDLLTARGTTTIGGGGAGSLFGSSLSSSLHDVFGSLSASGTNYTIDDNYKMVKNNFGDGIDLTYGGAGENTAALAQSKGGLNLQVGALSGQKIVVNIEAMNARAIGIEDLKVDSFLNAGDANARIDEAIEKVSTQRSQLGAKQNRLEHTIANLDNTGENVESAESRIRDTDMAREMVRYSAMNIIEQAGQAMLAQANQSNQGVLSLLS